MRVSVSDNCCWLVPLQAVTVSLTSPMAPVRTSLAAVTASPITLASTAMPVPRDTSTSRTATVSRVCRTVEWSGLGPLRASGCRKGRQLQLGLLSRCLFPGPHGTPVPGRVLAGGDKSTFGLGGHWNRAELD